MAKKVKPFDRAKARKEGKIKPFHRQVIDDARRLLNPTDRKVNKALDDAGVSQIKDVQDRRAGNTRRKA